MDFICVTRSGSSNKLIISVCRTIAQPQFGTTWLYVHLSHRNSGLAIIPKKPKSTRPLRSLSAPDTPGTGTFCRTSNSLGPTKMRSAVGPCRLPTAAPITSTFTTSFESGFWGSRATDIELCNVTIATEFGSFGINTAAKYWSVGPAQWNGPGIVLPPLMSLHFENHENPHRIGRRTMSLLN